MKTEILVGAYRDGKVVEKSNFHGYDGKKLDGLLVYACITSYEECQEVIKTLEIHKHCFERQP